MIATAAHLRAARPERLARRAVVAFLVLVGALCLFLALVVPYHATDALVYGRFSREIGRTGGFLFDQIGFPPYSRPLFYVPQGWLWWVFGAHEWIGRLLSLAFFGLLLWSLARLARDRALPPGAALLAVLLPFAAPDVVVQAFAGQTDVPVAALVALTGVLLWRRPATWGTAALIVLAAAAAVLAKATALPALAGLALAQLLGSRAGLPRRVARGVLPLAVGTGLGLVYGVLMADHFGLALNEFLGGVAGGGGGAGGAAGAAVGAAPGPSAVGRVGTAVTSFTDSDRPGILLRAEWLGPYLRLLVIFAVVYAVARVVRVPHRGSVLAALVVGLAGYWIGPEVLAGGASVTATGAGALAGSVLLTIPLAATAWAPPDAIPGRLPLARLLAWGLPPLIAWGLFGILGDTRTLSPAWPALFVLAGAVAAMGVAGLSARRTVAGALAIVLLLGLAVLDLRNLDGLGARPDGTVDSVRALADLGPSTWLHPDRALVAADPQLGGELRATRGVLPPGGRVLSNDGRFAFYFLDRVEVAAPPSRCAGLRGYRVLAVLLNSFGPDDYARLRGLSGCLRPVASVPGSYAVYRVA